MDIERLLNEALSEGKKSKGKRPLPSVNFKNVIMKVTEKLREGDSQLKHIFERGYTMDQVIWAIKNRKCIANLGSTYLEQTISGTIQDLIKDSRLARTHLNDYRRIFGLPPMQAVGTKSNRPRAGHGRPTAVKSDKALVARLKKALR